MGNNHKFRLSWLYNKLRDPKTCTTITAASPRLKAGPDVIPPVASPNGDTRNYNIPRKSYYFTRELTVDTLAKHFLEGSLRKKSTQKTIGLKKEPVEEKSGRSVSSCSLSSSASATNAIGCSSPTYHQPRQPAPEFRFDHVLIPDPVDKTTSSSSSCTLQSLSNPDTAAGDVMIGVFNPHGHFPMSTEKKKKKKKRRKVVKDAVTERRHGSRKGFYLSTSAKSSGMSIRVYSPRLLAAARRMQARRGAVGPRRSGEANGKCGGFAVVKLSFDPWRDFRDSMVEMIVENRIKESEGLEDLLVCYLSLNSEVYHDMIIAAFKQVWFDLTNIRFNENSC